MRWRVGRKPTRRSMVRTSCQGQPLSSPRMFPPGRASPAVEAVLV
jgi:hypothetical protein